MDNIFQVGGQVTGNSFLGRKSLLNKFRKIYLDENSRVCKSIVGLTRIGKSSFANEVFHHVPQNLLLVKEDFKEITSYGELWQDISITLEEKLKERNLFKTDLSECFTVTQSFQDVPWIKFIRYVKKLFSKIKESNLKIIFVFDEFDYAQELFENETKYYELFRTIFSSSEYNISALLISRRSLHVIEGATYQSSTFHGVFDPVQFSGFDDDDINEYFSVFEKYGIKLNYEDRTAIEFYAGRLPYLLSVLGHYIVDEYAFKNICINIHELFITKCKAINNYYRDCIKHLERDNDLDRIIPFVIGPNLGVTQNDKDELISSGYLIVKNNTFIPISEYFQRFLTANNIKFPLGVGINTVESKLKKIVKDQNLISGELSLNDYNTSSDFLSSVVNLNMDSLNRYANYIFNDKKMFGRNSSYLDVLSLKDVVKIIKLYWNSNFSKYFNSDPLDKWDYKFDLCATARNPVQHAHEDYYSDDQKFEIDNYCKQIIKALSNIPDGSKIESTKQEYKISNSETLSIHSRKLEHVDQTKAETVPCYHNNQQISLGKQVLVKIIGTTSKGLSGILVKDNQNFDNVTFINSSLPENKKALVTKICCCEIVSYNQKTCIVKFIKISDK